MQTPWPSTRDGAALSFEDFDSILNLKILIIDMLHCYQKRCQLIWKFSEMRYEHDKVSSSSEKKTLKYFHIPKSMSTAFLSPISSRTKLLYIKPFKRKRHLWRFLDTKYVINQWKPKNTVLWNSIKTKCICKKLKTNGFAKTADIETSQFFYVLASWEAMTSDLVRHTW